MPITAIAASQVEPGLLGVLVAWAGIVGVNVAAGLRRADRRLALPPRDLKPTFPRA